MESMAGLKNKKILVTGGAGFIGSHLVEELVNQGADVTVIDLKIHPKSVFSVNKLKRKVKVKFLDIGRRNNVSRFFQNYTPSYIFHLAAEPIVGKALEEPYKTYETNIMGTINILEEGRKNKKIKGIIVASSDKAYGKTKDTYTEESPLRGDHPYDVSKSSADLISNTYYKTYGLPVVITRFGNVYGEGDPHFNRIIPGICEALIKNKTLLIRSDGTYVRDYLYVKDVVAGYIFLLKNLENIKGEAFNFSSGDNLSVIELIAKIEKALGLKIKYKILNKAKNEIPYQHLNDSKIKKLGWKNLHNFETSINSTLCWYRKILDEKNREQKTQKLKNKSKILLSSNKTTLSDKTVFQTRKNIL